MKSFTAGFPAFCIDKIVFLLYICIQSAEEMLRL